MALLAETTGVFGETAAGVTLGALREAARRRRDRRGGDSGRPPRHGRRPQDAAASRRPRTSRRLSTRTPTHSSSTSGSASESGLMAKRPLETFITLVLEEADAELAQAHRELYPERLPEQIPLSLTLLYPWIPAQSVSEVDLELLRAFFADRPGSSSSSVAWLHSRARSSTRCRSPTTSCARRCGRSGPCIPSTRRTASQAAIRPRIARSAGWKVSAAITFEQVAARVGPLLPVCCVVEAATLMEEFELDRCRVRETLPFGR